jgi:tetratricopeptide (TPR) repeat protein
LSKAQALILEALEAFDPDERVKLAKKALSISEDCVDAYIILADDLAENNLEKLRYYQQAVEAGEDFLGDSYFEEDVGHFWGLVETRPYMRALAGQAYCLWAIGEREEALEIFRRMLVLNPDDNQGIRYTLLNLLLDMERYGDVEDLLDQHAGEGEISWLFTGALLKYQEDGPSSEAKKLLEKAHQYNPFVKSYLSGEKRVPLELPFSHGFGDEEEAILYVAEHLNYWRKVPGAVDWLKRVIGM